MSDVLFRNMKRVDDLGYWFEEFIKLLGKPGDLLVECKKIDHHEYLLRFASADNEVITRSTFDDRTKGLSYRYVRGEKEEEFVKVQSAHTYRYSRISGIKGAGLGQYVITNVTARDNCYPVYVALAPFMQFDREEKTKRFQSDDKDKVLRLIEAQLASAFIGVEQLGGVSEVVRDMEKLVELLHVCHKGHSYFNNGIQQMHFDLDRKTVSK